MRAKESGKQGKEESIEHALLGCMRGDRINCGQTKFLPTKHNENLGGASACMECGLCIGCPHFGIMLG